MKNWMKGIGFCLVCIGIWPYICLLLDLNDSVGGVGGFLVGFGSFLYANYRWRLVG